MKERKRMDIREFRERGYLQELNRRFLHPLGLALEVIIEEDGSERLGGVWDCRDDPEGIRFDFSSDEELQDSVAKARCVVLEEEARQPAREAALGYWIQPTARW